MTTLTIGSKSFPITSYTKKRDTKRGFYLDLYIPQESIGMDELFNLLNNNEETIVITTSDGTENIFKGFKELAAISCEGGVYNVAQVCTSEYEAQLSLAQSKIAEQDSVIEQQTATMAVLEEMNMMQLSTIESLLLEVIPTVITETVTIAVEEALASNSPSVE
jgi:hypothetical protein